VAFARYEQRLRTFIEAKQRAALALMSFSVPRSRFALLLGTQVTKLLNLPFVAELAVGRQIRDRLNLPDY
jgi:hypothetical protein